MMDRSKVLWLAAATESLTVVCYDHERTPKVHTATAYLETLNPEQRRAVEHGAAEGLAAALLLVIAGAGRRRLLRRHPCPGLSRLYSFVFNCASFSAINARISADISSSFSHCSLYRVTGKRPIP